MKEDKVVRVESSLHGRVISQIAAICRKLKKSGEDLLRNYFELGRLVDTLHKDGYSYREIERTLRSREPDGWIPRHTTLFSAHKFYLAVQSYFNGSIEDFLKKNPDITWKGLSRRVLSENRLSECSTVEQGKINTSNFVSNNPPKQTSSMTVLLHAEDETTKDIEAHLTGLPPKKVARVKGRPIDELLRDENVWKSVPSDKFLRMLIEYVFPEEKGIGPYPVITLSPPHEYLKVLVCPNCMKALRGAALGALVACLECGFPNELRATNR